LFRENLRRAKKSGRGNGKAEEDEKESRRTICKLLPLHGSLL
jgi:hypothetical protein